MLQDLGGGTRRAGVGVRARVRVRGCCRTWVAAHGEQRALRRVAHAVIAVAELGAPRLEH